MPRQSQQFQVVNLEKCRWSSAAAFKFVLLYTSSFYIYFLFPSIFIMPWSELGVFWSFFCFLSIFTLFNFTTILCPLSYLGKKPRVDMTALFPRISWCWLTLHMEIIVLKVPRGCIVIYNLMIVLRNKRQKWLLGIDDAHMYLSVYTDLLAVDTHLYLKNSTVVSVTLHWDIKCSMVSFF